MISKTLNSWWYEEKGAVEFVESSLVFSSILIFIGLLVILTFTSLKAIYTQESTYFSLINYLVADDYDPSYKDKSINRSDGLIYSASNKEVSKGKTMEVERINFYLLSRKLDFINDFVEEFGIDDKLSEIYKSKTDSLKKLLKQ